MKTQVENCEKTKQCSSMEWRGRSRGGPEIPLNAFFFGGLLVDTGVAPKGVGPPTMAAFCLSVSCSSALPAP